MNTVLLAVLQMSAFGALLVCALLALREIFRKKAPQWLLYYAWIIVLVRLLIPFGLSETMMPQLQNGADEPAIVEHVAGEQDGSDLGAGGSNADTSAQNPKEIATTYGEGLGATLHLAWNWLTSNLWVVWVAGAAGVLLYKVTLYQGFVRYIRAGMRPCDDLALLDRLAELGDRVGVKKPVELCVNPLASSPMLLAQKDPCIVLPTTDLPQTDLDYILLHELIHLRRHDAWYKWAVQIAVCIHWFNPLAHLMAREVNRDCELSCDEAVLRIKGSEPQEYGATLLRAMATSGTYKERVPSVTLAENKELLKERMEIIAKSKKTALSAVLCVLLAGLVVLFAGCTRIVIPTYHHSFIGTNVDAPAAAVDGSSLVIDVSSCPVIVELTDDDKVSAQYDDSRFEVILSQEEEEQPVTTVECNGLRDARNQYVRLQVPRSAFDNVELSLASGFLGWAELPSSSISGTLAQGAAILGLPAGFSGSVVLDATQGMLSLCSQDGFANCDVSAQASGSLVNVPSTFTRERNGATYVSGNGSNKINVVMTEGLLRLEDTDADTKIMEYAAQGDGAALDEIPDRIRDIVDEYTSVESVATRTETPVPSDDVLDERTSRIASDAERIGNELADRITKGVTKAVEGIDTTIVNKLDQLIGRAFATP